jgi:NTE family protein
MLSNSQVVNRDQTLQRPSIGLALSGGGARGLAHIGVLKVLEREGIPIDCLAGTSMGGVIAAGYAAGMSPQELEREAMAKTRLRQLLHLADPRLPNAGLLRGQRLLEYFESHVGKCTFADLERPLALVAVDLNAGREVVLIEGSVALALRATTAVPGLIMPVELNGQRLVDGGVLNNLPVNAAKQLSADVVVAVNVEPDPQRGSGGWVGDYRWLPEGLSRTLTVLDEAARLMLATIQEDRLNQHPPDILIHPHLPSGVNLLVGYSRVAELIATGECAAEEALPDIRRILHTPLGQRVDSHLRISRSDSLNSLSHKPAR